MLHCVAPAGLPADTAMGKQNTRNLAAYVAMADEARTFVFTASAGNIYGNIYHSTRGVCCIRGCSKNHKSSVGEGGDESITDLFFYLSSY